MGTQGLPQISVPSSNHQQTTKDYQKTNCAVVQIMVPFWDPITCSANQPQTPASNRIDDQIDRIELARYGSPPISHLPPSHLPPSHSPTSGGGGGGRVGGGRWEGGRVGGGRGWEVGGWERMGGRKSEHR